MKLGKLIAGIGIGTVIGMLCAPKKGSELRKDIKDKSKDLYDKAQNISKEDIQELINNTIDEIKLAIDEFDADEFKENAGQKINEVKSKLEELAVSVKSSEEYANFKESVTKVSNEVTTKLKEIKTKIQDQDFNEVDEFDGVIDDIEDELDVIIEDLKD
ncbi:YtxH domain-containing protein [uncultured Thomasclavelia sp.]|uniref:YtxH domain-containing protein n=1 Tax=uncultured Thomasclavelia sp. TaxID=3025759 RepID=UPI00261B34D3|nr:YtxH domain-containing protein [uncultured Thomasclavelia sp.]